MISLVHFSGHSLSYSEPLRIRYFRIMATGGTDAVVFSREEQRAVIRFLWLKGQKGDEIHKELRSVLGESAFSRKTVFQWIADFKGGRTSIKDEPRSGHPSTAVTQGMIEKAGKLARENRKITVQDLSDDLGISIGSTYTILHDHLHMRKLMSQWVPHVLTENHLKKRVETSAIHLARARREGPRFFDRIVAGDETWVTSFEPELKRQSAVWRGNSFGTGEVRLPQQAKPAGFKVMHIIFFDYQGILLDHAVPRGTMVNAEYYKKVLSDHLRPAIRKKRRELLEAGPIVLHDNARPHVARVVTDLLDRYGWEMLAHPPYSPDLSPCDFFLFGRLKAKLRGVQFNDEREVNAATKQALDELAKDELRSGIYGLQERWEKCVRDEGRYWES